MKTGGKLCALMLVHYSPELFGRLLLRLEQFGVPAFVHIDRKVDAAPFLGHCERHGATLVDGRVEIRWGGYSIIEATLQLIEAALANEDFTHFLLLSGDTYPIRPGAEFRDHLLSSTSRIQVHEVARVQPTYQRIARLYLPDSGIGALLQSGGDPSLGRYMTPEVVSRFAEIQDAFALKTGVFPWKFAKGSQWWCMTRRAIERCLEVVAAQQEYVTWFKYSSVPDESFFQSLFLNFVDEPFANSSPIFTVWDRMPKPYVFATSSDLELLSRCKTVLARKFSERHASLLDDLDLRLDAG